MSESTVGGWSMITKRFAALCLSTISWIIFAKVIINFAATCQSAAIKLSCFGLLALALAASSLFFLRLFGVPVNMKNRQPPKPPPRI